MEKPTRSKAFIIADDSLDFLKAGIESVIDDQVTCRFSGRELKVWNLMTRSSTGHQYVSLKYTVIWGLGFLFRYFVLFPVRLIIFLVGIGLLVASTAIIGYLPQGKLKRWLNTHLMLMCFRVLARALSIVATYHNSENKAKPGGICVANHTSPLDVQMLSMDNVYAFVGQSQGGFLGFLQKTMSRASAHIWFERSAASDRQAVSRMLKEHVEDVNKSPVLIFPEGTCINNTSIMMFKKGSFEVGGTIYPAAIKYDPRFGEAFWNSSRQTYAQYILMLMTSWATVVDVYYLPPTTKRPDENGMQFAARVKHDIAAAGGLVELDWDGDLKRKPVKKEMVDEQRQRWGKRVQMAPNRTLDLTDTADSVVDAVAPSE